MNDKRLLRMLTRARLVPLAAALALLAACGSTSPSMGGNKGVVAGSAAGSSSEGSDSRLEKCGQTLGTVSLDEDTSASWYHDLRRNQLGSTLPVLRLMIQQSNCFVIVERGRALGSVMRERELDASGEMRQGSNFQKGQMVAADYTMSPSVFFAGRTSGVNAGLLTGKLGVLGAVAGNVKRNEAATTLLLIDNRSGVQIAAAEGTAGNFDFGFFGAHFLSGLAGGGGGYASTPQGKVVVAAFADSYNQMVRSLRVYKAQTVQGGLGAGGRLGVDGGSTPASREVRK